MSVKIINNSGTTKRVGRRIFKPGVEYVADFEALRLLTKFRRAGLTVVTDEVTIQKAPSEPIVIKTETSEKAKEEKTEAIEEEVKEDTKVEVKPEETKAENNKPSEQKPSDGGNSKVVVEEKKKPGPKPKNTTTQSATKASSK